MLWSGGKAVAVVEEGNDNVKQPEGGNNNVEQLEGISSSWEGLGSGWEDGNDDAKWLESGSGSCKVYLFSLVQGFCASLFPHVCMPLLTSG